jgi:hypothetical protein
VLFAVAATTANTATNTATCLIGSGATNIVGVTKKSIPLQGASSPKVGEIGYGCRNISHCSSNSLAILMFVAAVIVGTVTFLAAVTVAVLVATTITGTSISRMWLMREIGGCPDSSSTRSSSCGGPLCRGWCARAR